MVRHYSVETYTEVNKLQNIEQLTNDIRDIINSPRNKYVLLQDSAAWNMLCSCLDVIEDTNCCLEAFLTTDIERFDSDSQYLDDGNKYMYVYGTLQALFMQQDAVKHLAESLQIPYTLDPQLKEIRDIRNDSIGHPTKRSGGTGRAFNFISRTTINNQGFQLGTAYADGRPYCFKDVDIPDLIAKQRCVFMGVLGDVLETLREKEMEHKNKFADKKLADAFRSLSDRVKQIFEAILSPESAHAKVSVGNVNFILKRIEQFRAELAERKILEAYEGLTCDLELVDYPLQELRKYFCNPDETHINKKDAFIFADFAEKQVQKLLECAKGLDEEYSQ